MMSDHADLGGKWSIVFATDTYSSLTLPGGRTDFLLEPSFVRARLAGYKVVADPALPKAWDDTFLAVRGAQPFTRELTISALTDEELSRAGRQFRDLLPTDRRIRNRMMRLEGDVFPDGSLQLIEVFLVPKVIMKHYPLLFIVFDDDGGPTSPGGSAVAIRR